MLPTKFEGHSLESAANIQKNMKSIKPTAPSWEKIISFPLFFFLIPTDRLFENAARTFQ